MSDSWRDMRGDKLHVTAEHRRAGRALANHVLQRMGLAGRPYIVAIGGESGSGKSELAEALRGELEDKGVRTTIVQQDDYFVYPPLTNDALRREDLGRVGVSEVGVDLLEEHLARAKAGADELRKPLVLYQEDRITEERVVLSGVQVLIVEGTYTTVLNYVDLKVFIERDYHDTHDARKARGRELQDDYLECILAKEHAIITGHRLCAHLVVTRAYEVVEQRPPAPAGFAAG